MSYHLPLYGPAIEVSRQSLRTALLTAEEVPAGFDKERSVEREFSACGRDTVQPTDLVIRQFRGDEGFLIHEILVFPTGTGAYALSGISEGWFNCPALSDGKFFRFTGDFGDETVALQFRNEDSLLRHVYIRRGDFIALLVVVDIDDEADGRDCRPKIARLFGVEAALAEEGAGEA